MESKNAFVASKMMLDFIRDFTKLNEAQLLAVRSLMQDTVGQVMQLIMDINSIAEGSMVSEPSSQAIVERFTKGVETVTLNQDRISVLVSSLMGSVSSEDIIHQRISHVHQAVGSLNNALIHLIQNIGSITPDRISDLRNMVLTSVYTSYSTEEERHIFHGIFGRPRRKTSAA